MKASAQCECGQLKLEVSSPPVVQLVCHCKECQAFSGSRFVNGAFFRKDDCQIEGKTSIETLIGGTGANKLHHSCSVCGDPIYVQVTALNGAVAIQAEKLSPFEFSVDAHVWTSQKASDTVIPEDVPQSPSTPPDDIVKRMVKSFFK